MYVLIIGSGGREHALAWKAAQSQLVDHVYVAPGNAGTALENKVENVAIQATDISSLLDFAKSKSIDLTIVGPEAPLANGIVNEFRRANLACFGPLQEAAKLETSKSFCKDFLQKHHIPTAKYETFTEIEPAKAYVRQQKLPIVIKADGLAAGKGVVIAETLAEADDAITQMLSGSLFGNASQTIVIEDFLTGKELSFIVMSDGKHILPLASSQDHKRRDDGDLGPNTGGMGAFSPSPLLNGTLNQKILQQIIQPVIAGLASSGIPYVGFLYAGLMIDDDGNPHVLEFNCRLGDPETQPLMMRLESDLITLCIAALNEKLDEFQVKWNPQSALTVVLAAGGYPHQYHKGDIIEGLDSHENNHIKIFHAGTTMKQENIVTNGGRVLGVTALGKDLKAAHDKAYAAVSKINWSNCYFRKDIGLQAIQSLEKTGC